MTRFLDIPGALGDTLHFIAKHKDTLGAINFMVTVLDATSFCKKYSLKWFGFFNKFQ